jgi:hypothetical protein
MKRSTFVAHQTRSLIGRISAWALVPAMVLTAMPMPASAAPRAPSVILSPQLPTIVGEGSSSAAPPSLPSSGSLLPSASQPAPAAIPPKVKVNRTVPAVRPFALYPTFSAQPTAAEIVQARVFSEPLMAIGDTTPAENTALARAITAYVHGASPEQVAPFQTFLDEHGSSAWRPSLLASLASLYWRTGLFTRAVRTWEEAWRLAKDTTEADGRATADRAVGELMQALVAFGRSAELEAISKEVGDRAMRGTAAEKVRLAREGLSMMLDHRNLLTPSAVVAIGRVLSRAQPGYKGNRELAEYRSGRYGVTLVEARDLAVRVGLKMQMAWRPAGAAVVVPSIVHSRLDHYAAIVARDEARGRYLMDDPLVQGQTWLSEGALSEDASGYALVPEGPLPEGWRSVRESEAAVVVGRCVPPEMDGGGCPTCENGGGPGGGGPGGPGGPSLGRRMATYQLLRPWAALRIVDAPVGYSPARGPAVEFEVAYNHREALQPQTFTFSNLGPRWTHSFYSYVQDDPADLSGDILVFARSGGYERHRDIDSPTYKPHWESFTALVRTSTDPIRYEARHADGSVDVYAQLRRATASGGDHRRPGPGDDALV